MRVKKCRSGGSADAGGLLHTIWYLTQFFIHALTSSKCNSRERCREHRKSPTLWLLQIFKLEMNYCVKYLCLYHHISVLMRVHFIQSNASLFNCYTTSALMFEQGSRGLNDSRTKELGWVLNCDGWSDVLWRRFKKKW